MRLTDEDGIFQVAGK